MPDLGQEDHDISPAAASFNQDEETPSSPHSLPLSSEVEALRPSLETSANENVEHVANENGAAEQHPNPPKLKAATDCKVTFPSWYCAQYRDTPAIYKAPCPQFTYKSCPTYKRDIYPGDLMNVDILNLDRVPRRQHRMASSNKPSTLFKVHPFRPTIRPSTSMIVGRGKPMSTERIVYQDDPETTRPRFRNQRLKLRFTTAGGQQAFRIFIESNNVPRRTGLSGIDLGLVKLKFMSRRARKRLRDMAQLWETVGWNI